MIIFIRPLFILFAFSLTAQKNNVIFNLPNSLVLYEGYSSVLQVGFSQKKIKKLNLACEGCDTLYQISKNDPTKYVVIPGKSTKIILQLKDRKKNIIDEQFEIKVTKPPTPTLKIDHQDSQQTLKKIPENLQLENSPNIPITSGYAIISWSIKIQDAVFTGFTSKLTQSLKEYLLQKVKDSCKSRSFIETFMEKTK